MVMHFADSILFLAVCARFGMHDPQKYLDKLKADPYGGAAPFETGYERK
jgi:hypothetical protein